MEQTQEVATLPIALPALPDHLVKYKGWIGLAIKKEALIPLLTKAELASQSVLKSTEDIVEREKMEAEYRKAHKEAQEARLSFTRYIETNLFEQVMAFEKRMDPKTNATFLSYVDMTRAMKIASEVKAKQGMEKQTEAAQFRAHVSSDIERRVLEYRTSVLREIGNYYQTCLTGKVENPETRQLKETLMAFKLAAPAKFARRLHTEEEFIEIWKSIRQPDIKQLQAGVILDAEAKFLLYENDFASGNTEISVEEELLELKQEADTNIALNTLAATVENVPQFVVGGKKLKREITITVAETEVWAKAVIMNFLKYPECSEKLSNRKWSSLTVAQMASALGKYCTEKEIGTLNGLALTEVVK